MQNVNALNITLFKLRYVKVPSKNKGKFNDAKLLSNMAIDSYPQETKSKYERILEL